MKIGITLSCESFDFPYIVYNGTSDIALVFDKLKKTGYDGIDFFAGNPPKEQLDIIKKNAKNSGIEIANYLPIGLAQGGNTLTDNDKQKRQKCIDGYKREMERAAFLESFSITVGTARGRIKKEDDTKRYFDRLAESMHRINDFAKGTKMQICIEAINRLEVNTLNSAKDCLWFIEEYNLNGVVLLLDVFHMNIEEKDIRGALLSAENRIGHVHIEDTNRLFPGGGHADYVRIFDALSKIKYSGYVSVEASPWPSADVCASKSVEYLKQFI